MTCRRTRSLQNHTQPEPSSSCECWLDPSGHSVTSRMKNTYAPYLYSTGPMLSAERVEGGPMLCRRCKGRLVLETFGDLSEELARMCAATRCINCGCIGDSVVRTNPLRH